EHPLAVVVADAEVDGGATESPGVVEIGADRPRDCALVVGQLAGTGRGPAGRAVGQEQIVRAVHLVAAVPRVLQPELPVVAAAGEVVDQVRQLRLIPVAPGALLEPVRDPAGDPSGVLVLEPPLDAP